MLKRALPQYEDLELEEGELPHGEEEDSHLSEEETFQSAVLPVGKFNSAANTLEELSGEEYLALVQRQRRHLPAIVFTDQGPLCAEAPICDLDLKADYSMEILSSWAESYWDTFCGTLQQLQRALDCLELDALDLDLPSTANRDGWYEYIYKCEAPVPPSYSILKWLQIEEHQIVKLLQHHSVWLESVLECDGRIDHFFTWMFALLMTLDPRCLKSEQCCVLRDLAKVLKQKLPDHAEVKAAFVVISRRFGQHDLVSLL